MDGLIFPILLAVSAAMLVLGIARLVFGGGDLRQRMFQRLSGDSVANRTGAKETSIVLQSGATGLSKTLNRQNFFQSVQSKLRVAYPKTSLARFVIISGFMGVCTLLIVMSVVESLLVPISAGLAGAYLPFMLLGMKYNKRNKLLAEQLPEALDFLARILRAGHSLSTGLQMMGTELPDPLAAEFRRCYDQHSLGQSLEDCLRDMTKHVTSTEFAFFITAVLIQRQTGGDLSTVLNNISATIRARIRLAGFVRAKTAEGRFTGYILIAFPILMFFLAYSLNPDYGGKLLHTPSGHKLLGTAAVLQIMGLIAIRKLTTVKV